MAKLSLNHIYKVYDNNVKAVNDVNLEINDKEFIVFVGPSGCGKSTTLRMIAGLEDITSGELRIGDDIVNDIEPKDRDIAMVFQNYALYPHMTVYENMAFGLKLKKTPKDVIHRKILEAADILGITEYLDRKPKAMSGGQRQRVALGRAILRNPKVFLLDEPLSNLDAKLRTQMRAEILKLYKKLNTTFIYVTHDQVEAMTMGTRIVVMKDGVLQQVDTPKNLYKYPCNKFVAGFIGTPQMNFFNSYLIYDKDNYYLKIDNTDVMLNLSSKHLLKVNKKYLDGSTKVVFGIRCEHIKIATNNDKNVIPIKVSHLEELGDETLVYGDVNLENEEFTKSESRIIVKTTADREYSTGDIIYISFDFKHMQLFDYNTQYSIIPRIPQDNIVNGTIINRKLKLLSKEYELPNVFFDLKEQKYQINIPIDAIVEGNDFVAKIVNIEIVQNIYLLYLKIGENIIFTTTEKVYKIGDDINLSIDLKQISIFNNELIVKKSLPLINKLNSTFIKVKDKSKKEINFKLNINEQNIFIPNSISEKILKSLGLKAFNSSFVLSFNPYSYDLSKEGIKGNIIDILDYGNEQFLKIKVGSDTIYLNDKYNLKQGNSIHFLPNYENIGLKESKLNIKII